MSIIRSLLNLIPHDTIYREGGVPYLRRYYLLGGPRRNSKFPFNLYLHQFLSSDEPIAHSHPWKRAWSLILHGEYLEFRPEQVGYAENFWKKLPRVTLFYPGMVNKLEADDFHWVELVTDEVWTLFLSGKRVQDWGFQTPEGYVDYRTYIASKPGASSTRP